MFETMKEWFASWNSSRKAQKDYEEEDEIVSRFQVKELGGELYLTCNGTTYQHLSPELTAKEIVDRLTEARLSALRYRKLNRAPHLYLRAQINVSEDGSSRLAEM